MTTRHAPTGPVHLPDGSVVVPAHLAAAVRRILIRDLAQHVRTDGAAPTHGVRQLLYALGRAEHHDQAHSSAHGTPTAAPVRVEISTDTAALALGCSVEYVRRLCRSGRILGRRIGRAWLVDRASLDAWRYGRNPTCPDPRPSPRRSTPA